ncbi:hypothetical protein LX36DRAFT_465668 [Colletotrichum falcatum]|nr:hypothetical protein LX36DRAFT_465668 [Colletotrichum falcatum]
MTGSLAMSSNRLSAPSDIVANKKTLFPLSVSSNAKPSFSTRRGTITINSHLGSKHSFRKQAVWFATEREDWTFSALVFFFFFHLRFFPLPFQRVNPWSSPPCSTIIPCDHVGAQTLFASTHVYLCLLVSLSDAENSTSKFVGKLDRLLSQFKA